MNDVERWYENITYTEAKTVLQENMDNIKVSFIAAGYYLKYIRDNGLFREDGYESIWDFAEDNYGIKKSTASRWMAMNDKFSKEGNSPILAEEFRGFEKSQLQEMLYLDDKQIETVTPDMTVKDIREVRKPEPLSAYGTKKRVYPADSLLTTAGCENHDCFSCAQQCEIRGEDRYCMEAPIGNAFPCETMNSIPFLREAFGEKCMFINADLAGKCLGSGEAAPCCKDCKTPCARECSRAYQRRIEKRDSARGESAVAMSQQVSEEQLPGQMSIEDFPEILPDQADIITGTAIDADTVEVETVESDGSSDKEKFEELSDQTDKDLLGNLLEKAKEMLHLMLEEFSENDIRVRKQKLIVGAYSGMMYDLDEFNIPKLEQPELPKLKNNEQRKRFLGNYQTWPVWFEVPQASEVYHRFDLPDGSSIVICEYHMWLSWKEKYSDENPHSTGTREYLLKPGYHYLHDCRTNITELVDHLKNVQKEGK